MAKKIKIEGGRQRIELGYGRIAWRTRKQIETTRRVLKGQADLLLQQVAEQDAVLAAMDVS